MEITQQKGHLALIGGAEDKVYDKLVLNRTMSLNSPKTVSIIPSASARYAEDLGKEYSEIFRRFGATTIHVLDIRLPEEAHEPKYVQMVEESEMIFFTGGDQVRLVELINDSPVLEEVRKRHQLGATIAGTSAGAAAASDPMIYDGDKYSFQKGTVNSSEGFGFLPGVTIDTHFVKRGRIARLIQSLSGSQSPYAVGLAEDTALIVGPDQIGEVTGSGVVTVLSGKDLSYTNYHEIEEEDQITVDGLRLGVLAAGAVFDLNQWRVVV